MKSYATVIGIVQFKDKILFLKRSSDRKSSPNKWQPVSGFIREREAAEDAVLREVKEETGLDGKIIKIGKVFEVSDQWGRWIIMTFLVSVDSNNVNIDCKEHSEHKWIKPEEITQYDCVEGIEKDLEVVGLK